ncbi:MAG: hypothetical protein QN168_06920 [Armatimonadota bacterium]|nr:hypothetical protein [Armatimonadota bacterium]
MAGRIVARFLVDRPVRPGMVRAILDTLSAQGGAYEPQLIRRATDEGPRRITWSRMAGLLDDIGQAGLRTTFLRVSDGRPEPVLSFSMSASPRSDPSRVTMTIPAAALAASSDVEQVLGVCKGLYLFLESPWGTVELEDAAGSSEEQLRTDPSPPAVTRPGAAASPAPSGDAPTFLRWANFFGPQVIARVGPARLLTSMAFIVEILPDGGIMLVTHPSPQMAATPEGRALQRQIEDSTGIGGALSAFSGGRRRPPSPSRLPRTTGRRRLSGHEDEDP